MRIIKMSVLVFVLVCFCAGCGFKKEEYQITTKIEGNGYIDVPNSAKEGQKVEVQIFPEAGHYLESIIVSGEEQTDNVKDEVYIIPEISGDVEIEVKFTPGVIYATEKPVIDGTIDASWEKAAKLYANQHLIEIPGEGKFQNTGYVSLMWDEQYLYLLGVVEDGDVSEEDRINFWISESFKGDLGENAYAPYSSDLSYGMYYSIVNPYGKQFLYYSDKGRPVDFSGVGGYICRTGTLNEDRGGYIVEIMIPKQSSAEWKAGHLLGFDVSIDTYYTGETERAIYNNQELYCYWNGAGAYWSDASKLGSLMLLK